jgi:hypothetical protein
MPLSNSKFFADSWLAETRGMRRLLFTCDGCDLNEHVVLQADGAVDGMLRSWIAHRLVAYENGVATYDITVDLCPECSTKMRHAINPSKWPRMDSLSQTFGKKPAA